MKLYLAPHFKRAGPIYLILEYKSKLWQIALKDGQVRIYTTKPDTMNKLTKDLASKQAITLDHLLSVLSGNESIVYDPLAMKVDESGREYAELVEPVSVTSSLTVDDIPLTGED